MILRLSNIRSVVLLIIVTLIVFIFIERTFFTYTRFQPNDNARISSLFKENVSFSQLNPSLFANSPIHNELAGFKSSPPRISPSELAKPVPLRVYETKSLTYDETVFRQSSFPILWLDEQHDVRWNEAAEGTMITYLTQKQFPDIQLFQTSSINEQEILNTCRERSLFVLQQHWSGFFSRVLCFIAQFGQTLYTPRIGVLRGARFDGGRGNTDDFLGQGITRYFLPFSICSTYMYHPKMTKLKDIIDGSRNIQHITRSHELHDHGNDNKDHVLYSSEFWKMDYHHVPIRKWLFDRKPSSISYNSSINILIDHSDEHIYAPNNIQIGEWINQNAPDAFSSDLLPNKGSHKLTWQDYIFGSFLRYMFVLFFGSQNTPRIEYGTRILAQHWSSLLIDKYSLSTNDSAFSNLAGLYIRRGDKSTEDSFWHKNRRWRNISYYIKGIVDEEKRRKLIFKSIFVMTDDTSVMNSLHDYADTNSKGTDEPYAREHLRGRDILYNVLAPQVCFDPFRRIGFDQFLVSMRFLIEHAAFTVGHTDSNVFRFFREVIYAQRQQQRNVQTFTFIRNAPDSF